MKKSLFDIPKIEIAYFVNDEIIACSGETPAPVGLFTAENINIDGETAHEKI